MNKHLDSHKASKVWLRILNKNNKGAFYTAAEEWGGPQRLTTGWKDDSTFEQILELHAKNAAGVDLPDGFVPQVQFYGFVDGVIVGRLSLRTRLTEALKEYGGNIGYVVHERYRRNGYATEMMKQVLPVAFALGMDSIAIDCAYDNVASTRVIEKSGGHHDITSWNKEHKCFIKHYTIYPEKH
jgi:predicted acetyltransferase